MKEPSMKIYEHHLALSFSLLLCALATSFGLGCGEEEPPPLSAAEKAELEQNQAIDIYNARATELEQNRAVLLDAQKLNMVGPVFAVGDQIFWRESEGAWESLHSMDMNTREKTAYTFPITLDSYDAPLAFSDKHIVSLSLSDGKVTYHVYAVGEPALEVGSFEMDAPPNAKWWTFGVDGGQVYIIKDTPATGPDNPSRTEILAWSTTEQAQRLVTTTEELGIAPGIVQNMDVDDDQLMLLESGRLWHIDLETLKATWMESGKELGSAYYDRQGVLYSDAASTLRYYDLEVGELRDISEEIDETGWVLDEKYFDTVRFYTGSGITLVGDLVIYISTTNAVMSYNLTTREVRPLLLSPRNYGPEDDPVKFTYADPVGMEDGTLLVHAYTSFGKRTPAERWVYTVELP